MHRIGQHWMRVHPDSDDFGHVKRMGYRSGKAFEWMWSDKDFCRDWVAALPADALLLARDHPLSEQKADLWANPEGTGKRHANEWAAKVKGGAYHLPVARSYFLGLNEPDATSGDRAAIDRYTVAFLDTLAGHGLKGGAFNFSTGHPRTIDGTPDTPPDYSVFEASHQAIVRGGHIGVLHIYGTAAMPCVPGHYDRLKWCLWRDVTWVVGECGIDEHVVGGGEHVGYIGPLAGQLPKYTDWIDALILGTNEPRIHSWQVFTYDFSHPWDTFNVREVRAALESYPWRHPQMVGAVPTNPTQPTGPYIAVPAGANVRGEPHTSAPILRRLPQGTPVQPVATNPAGTWLLLADGGWVHRELCANVPGNLPVHGSVYVPIVAGPGQPTQPDDAWARCLAFVLRWEGGWADNPADPGGATMKGITIGTYTRWRAAHGQPAPTKDDLRNISDAEVEQIYREWYWQASGADKLAWPLCLAHFNLAVNGGVERARQMLDASGGDWVRYMAVTLEWYTRLETFKYFGPAWTRRCADVLKVGSA